MKVEKGNRIRNLVSEAHVQEIHGFFETMSAYPHLCTSCGMCAGVCPTDAIEMAPNPFEQFVPKFIEENCIYCKKCVICCPGLDITDSTSKDIGDYLQVYLAYAQDSAHREQGASGGVISALSAWMLEEGLIEKAIMLSTEHSASMPEVAVNRTRPEVMRCSSSKYVTYPILTAVAEFDEKTLITTLPCESTAMRRMRRNNGYIFGLFCSKADTADLLKFLLLQEGIQPGSVNRVNYREGAWPGKVTIETTERNVQIPYLRSYYAAAYNGFYFAIQGCMLCPDYANEKADIAFGDPWGLAGDPDSLLGKTLMIVRTPKGMELVEKAIAGGIIQVERVYAKDVIRGHQNGIHFKKVALRIRLKMLQKMGLPLPKHNEDLSKKDSLFETLVQAYYIRNNFGLKRHYERVFQANKWVMFVERYIVHTFHTLYLRASGYHRRAAQKHE